MGATESSGETITKRVRLNVRNISASSVPFGAEMQSLLETPNEATLAEIIEIIQRFGLSALICKKNWI